MWVIEAIQIKLNWNCVLKEVPLLETRRQGRASNTNLDQFDSGFHNNNRLGRAWKQWLSCRTSLLEMNKFAGSCKFLQFVPSVAASLCFLLPSRRSVETALLFFVFFFFSPAPWHVGSAQAGRSARKEGSRGRVEREDEPSQNRGKWQFVWSRQPIT